MTPIKQDVVKYKNCVSSVAIRQTDVLAEKYKSSRRSLGKAIKATDDLEIIKSEIDYNMAEHYLTRSSKFISYLDIHKARYISIKMRKSIGYSFVKRSVGRVEAHLGMAPHGYNEADMRPVE